MRKNNELEELNNDEVSLEELADEEYNKDFDGEEETELIFD